MLVGVLTRLRGEGPPKVLAAYVRWVPARGFVRYYKVSPQGEAIRFPSAEDMRAEMEVMSRYVPGGYVHQGPSSAAADSVNWERWESSMGVLMIQHLEKQHGAA